VKARPQDEIDSHRPVSQTRGDGKRSKNPGAGRKTEVVFQTSKTDKHTRRGKERAEKWLKKTTRSERDGGMHVNGEKGSGPKNGFGLDGGGKEGLGC